VRCRDSGGGLPNVTVAGTVSVTATLNVLAEYENEKLVSVKCSGVKLRGGIRGE